MDPGCGRILGWPDPGRLAEEEPGLAQVTCSTVDMQHSWSGTVKYSVGIYSLDAQWMAKAPTSLDPGAKDPGIQDPELKIPGPWIPGPGPWISRPQNPGNGNNPANPLPGDM